MLQVLDIYFNIMRSAKFVYINTYLFVLFKHTPLNGLTFKQCKTCFIPIIIYSQDR